VNFQVKQAVEGQYNMISYTMNPAQSITAHGRVRSISIDIKKYGLPDINIRAKIYSYVPANFENGWPLPIVNFLGQSTNVIATSALTALYSTETFLFPDTEVTGQWTVVFSYEGEVLHDQNNFAVFGVGAPDIYVGGDFMYYTAQGDIWYLNEGYDMVFTCIYCNEGEVATTTTGIVTCFEYVLICTSREGEAQFGVVHCDGTPENVTVIYGIPQFLCLSEPPVPLDQNGQFDMGNECTDTTTGLLN
jgi:hypothetical protein